MRDVEIIKLSRDKLFEEMLLIVETRNLLTSKNKFKDMNEYDKKIYCYMTSTIEKLRLQIDTLAFVLNEDTELVDVSINKFYNVQNGIDKEILTSYNKKAVEL